MRVCLGGRLDYFPFGDLFMFLPATEPENHRIHCRGKSTGYRAKHDRNGADADRKVAHSESHDRQVAGVA